ncbi:uncharacterized protein LOC123657262 [Melitaea cinxia]|uniref:uncharacterized protein LOC123657262 n=1 Tax=Melitaea cinxia TaxID=113334 RepID=UPI001E2730D2|nr:uncharacterized protein LOC123657262 [Melitaea cinxia]
MINILSYIGMSLQSEVCLWTVLGILRTIFDATLFQVNANLKQVWHMKMPEELSLSVQRVLRTTISGVMLVECFTLYVYLASYIVLLYPVFLEERSTLVLPWLLLAAVRNFLCQLTSLALGLGTCVLLGPARPPCVKFVIMKLVSIMPAFYMWMLIFNYYQYLKMAPAFKTFPALLPPKDLDYGLELAVRRRRTKSLQGEDQLRKKLIANFYGEPATSIKRVVTQSLTKISEISRDPSISTNDALNVGLDTLYPLSVNSNRTMSDIGTYEDWFGSEVIVPRDTDRILEQFVLMLLRIGVFMKKECTDPVKFLSNSQAFLPQQSKIECPAISTEETETPPLVGNSKGKTASYLRDYPQIFMKKPSDLFGSLHSPEIRAQNSSIHNNTESLPSSETTKEISLDTVSLEQENRNTIQFSDAKNSKIHVHSQNDAVNYFHKTENIKQVENIDNREPEPNNLKQQSAESIESIINRMKVRAARNEISINDDKENNLNIGFVDRIKNNDSVNLPIKSSKQAENILLLNKKSKVSNKDFSGEKNNKKK